MPGAVLDRPLSFAPREEWLPPEAFPDSDGIPLETRDVYTAAALLRETILRADLRPDMDVGVNQFVYVDPTDPSKSLGPDLWVAVGVPPRNRQRWEAWTEGKLPDLVMEMVSPTSVKRDTVDKVLEYGRYGVREYFWFDPISLRWAGYRNRAGIMQPIRLERDATRISQVVGLKLRLWTGYYGPWEKTWLRWYGLDGRLLPTAEE
ncbi:MAG: Uma2 family endonuclease, partial [Armatimonadetes bacterium]|nr:Uma2 family endonuclease [Armatimonadota bacterium]